ncbi:MAG: glycosyltransferase [Lachnospiraceae bacterium]|nr:glycosyltransferase [Lachnospiraceae bacterium]
MEQKLVSVIVPIYNLENYLEKCIESLLKQTYTNLEIFLVDDGSKDSSGEICDRYGALDVRIRTIHQKNAGAAAARNAALDICRGEYITFVDGDDYIDADYVQTLVSCMEKNKSQIAICGWQDVYETTVVEERPLVGREELYSTEQALENLMYQRKFDTAMWSKLYRRELFDGIRFPIGNVYEDIAIIYKVFCRAERVSYVDYKGYFYLLREQGTTLQAFKPKKMDLIDVVDEMAAFLLPRYPRIRSAVLCKYMRANFHIYLQIPGEKDVYAVEKRRIEKNIKTYRKEVLCDKNAQRGTKVAILCSYISLPLLVKFKSLKQYGKK